MDCPDAAAFRGIASVVAPKVAGPAASSASSCTDSQSQAPQVSAATSRARAIARANKLLSTARGPRSSWARLKDLAKDFPSEDAEVRQLGVPALLSQIAEHMTAISAQVDADSWTQETTVSKCAALGTACDKLVADLEAAGAAAATLRQRKQATRAKVSAAARMKHKAMATKFINGLVRSGVPPDVAAAVRDECFSQEPPCMRPRPSQCRRRLGLSAWRLVLRSLRRRLGALDHGGFQLRRCRQTPAHPSWRDPAVNCACGMSHAWLLLSEADSL